MSGGEARTQVVIVGAGPAGMVLAHLLKARGIDCVVLERQSRAYVEGRVRAGVLEQGTVETLAALGLDGRLKRDGLIHRGVNLLVDGALFRIDLEGLTGRAVTVYGQQEVMKDLFDAAAARGIAVLFEAEEVRLERINGPSALVCWLQDGERQEVECDFIAGCDGFHGVSRSLVMAGGADVFERVYPFGWLGVLADVAPVGEELIYCNHEHGFALASMRSPTRSRYYVQCSLEDRVEHWPDARFWDEVRLRFGDAVGARIADAPSFEKSIAPLRSFVVEPMQHGRLFLTGDAAHIVPPAGAKGLNLAVSDVVLLAEAFGSFYGGGDESGLGSYSSRALARLWKAERFSWWFTMLMHRFPNMDAFDRKMQLAELDYIRTSEAAQTSFAENYVGLPLERH